MWTVQIKYGTEYVHSSSFNIGVGFVDCKERCTGPSLDHIHSIDRINGLCKWGFRFETHRHAPLEVRLTCAERGHPEEVLFCSGVVVPDGSRVAVEIDSSSHRLVLFVNDRKLPFVLQIGRLPVHPKVDISFDSDRSIYITNTEHQPSFASLSFTCLPSASSSSYPPCRVFGSTEGCYLFVYHLPPALTEGELGALFSPYGKTTGIRIFTDPNTGLSKGFGFVSYDNPTSAQSAISALNGYVVMGKRLIVCLKK